MATRPMIYIFAIALFATLYQRSVVHQIPEGHVGMYWRGGRLMDVIVEPGVHAMIPMLTRYETVRVTMHVDVVENVICGTKGGMIVRFDRVEVINVLDKAHAHDVILRYGIEYDRMWIFDLVRYELSRICSGTTLQALYIDDYDTLSDRLHAAMRRNINVHVDGLDVVRVSLSNPDLSNDIYEIYEEMEMERIKAVRSSEHMKFVQKQSEIIVFRKHVESRVANISNDIESGRERAKADTEHYRRMREADSQAYTTSRQAEVERYQLTPEYLRLRAIEAMGRNMKVYYGDSIPNFLTSDENMSG